MFTAFKFSNFPPKMDASKFIIQCATEENECVSDENEEVDEKRKKNTAKTIYNEICGL